MTTKRSRGRRAIAVGDVFAEALPDGRFGAVRVTLREGELSAVATTPYAGKDLPRIDDPLLSQCLAQVRFVYKGQLALVWINGNPSKEYVFVGNVPVSEPEPARPSDTSWQRWMPGLTLPAYWEWRWAHEREAFKAEAAQEMEELREGLKAAPKPKARMKDETFWGVIALFDWSLGDDDAAVVRPVVAALAAMPVRDINRFEEALAYRLYHLDTLDHERAAAGGGPGSSDGFLYARCAVVAAGKDAYEAALHDPSRMPQDGDFEPLLFVTAEAYALKTGKEFEYVAGYGYETGSNRAGWEGPDPGSPGAPRADAGS